VPVGTRRLRQVAILAVFIVGVFATAATSPLSTSIEIAPARSTLRLDAAHPAALARIVVRLGPEATSTYSTVSVSVSIDTLQPLGNGNSQPDATRAARFIVASTTPGGLPRAIESAVPAPAPVPSGWQAEARPGSPVSLRIDCGIGPCERAFWLIAELADETGGALEVDWHAQGSLVFMGTPWPSGAAANVEIEPPILVAGPAPQLVASTEPEPLTLGPDRPAAARVVEVRIGAAAIPQDASPVGTLSVELVARPGSRGSYERPPLVQIYPLGGSGEDREPGAPFPSPAAGAVDPFVGCAPGADCVRRFFVAIAWTGDAGDEEAYDWSVTVRRLDLVGAWSAPAELSASVERRYDIEPGSASTIVHLDGDASRAADAAPEVQLGLATSTTAADPPAMLLPAPIVMTYRSKVVEENTTPSPVDTGVHLQVTPSGVRAGSRPINRTFVGGEVRVVTNPLAWCRVGEQCSDVLIDTIRGNAIDGSPLPAVKVHWTLDLTVFSFTDVPVSLSVENHSPAAP
jgi:hypothetical protein